MNCKEFEELLSESQDNSLSPEQSVLISAHLKDCPKCTLLADDVNSLKSILPELNTEIPFFVKNRLYLINENYDTNESINNYSYIKWVAAMVGTIVLFLNLFYFTNILPSANKTLHTAVAGIERFIVEAEAFVERIKETNNFVNYNKPEKISKTNKKKDAKANKKIIRRFDYG